MCSYKFCEIHKKTLALCKFGNLYPYHKFLRRVTYANLSVDNRLPSTSKKRGENVSKMSSGRVDNNSLTWWYILKTSGRFLKDIFPRRPEDVLKMTWRRLEGVSQRRICSSWLRRLEDVLWRLMTKVNISILIKTSWSFTFFF